MYTQAMRAYLEGRGTLADVERAIAAARAPRGSGRLQADAEKELAADWEFKALFAALPPPPSGLPRLMQALRAAPTPPLNAETAAALTELNVLRESYADIPEPAGGYAAAAAALIQKISHAPVPEIGAVTGAVEFDIQPQLGQKPPSRKLVLLESSRKRGVTKKIIGLPRHRPHARDVLAAQKDDGMDGMDPVKC